MDTATPTDSGPTVRQVPRLLTAAEVQTVLGVSRTMVYRLIRDSGFPEAVRLGGRVVRWKADEVASWLDTRERVACDAASV